MYVMTDINYKKTLKQRVIIDLIVVICQKLPRRRAYADWQ